MKYIVNVGFGEDSEVFEFPSEAHALKYQRDLLSLGHDFRYSQVSDEIWEAYKELNP